jgi:hypothetical protein
MSYNRGFTPHGGGADQFLNLPLAQEIMAAAEGTPLEDDPDFKTAVVAAAVRNDADLAARLKEMATAHALENLVYPDHFPGPKEVPAGELPLGRAVHRGQLGEPVGLALSILARGPALISGLTGSGKTTVLFRLLNPLASLGVPFFFPDPENQGALLVEELGIDRVGILDYWELPLAIFQIPGVVPGQTPPAEIERAAKIYYPRLVANVFSQLWVGMGGSNELFQTILEECARNDAFQGSGRWPTMAQITSALEKKAHACRGNRKSLEYLNSLLNRMHGLMAALPGINCRSSELPEYVLRKSLVVRTHGLEAGTRSFVLNVLIAKISNLLERDIRGTDGSRPRIVVPLEEANQMVSKEGQPGGAPMEIAATSGRKRGLIPVFIVQGLENVAPLILGNAHTKLIFCHTDPQSRRALYGMMRMDPERDEVIKTLPRSRFIVSCNSWGAEPLLVEADEIKWPPLPEEATIRGWCEATLKEIKFETDTPAAAAAATSSPTAHPPTAQGVKAAHQQPSNTSPPAAGPAITVDGLNVLKDIAGRVDTAAKRATRLRLSPTAESLARKELEKFGLIEESQEGRIGKGTRFFILTSKGRDFAVAHGFRIAQFKSGPLHEYALREVCEKICTLLPGWKAERKDIAFDGVQLDALLCGPAGRRVGVQVSHASNTSVEAANVKTLCAAAGPDKVLVVCTTKQKAGQLGRAVAGLGVSRPDKVVITDFDSFEGLKDVGGLVGQ